VIFLKRLIKAKRKQVNHEEIANDLFSNFNMEELTEMTTIVVEEFNENVKKSKSEVDGNEYKFVLDYFSNENGYRNQAIDLAKLFGLDYNENMDDNELELLWEDIESIGYYLGKKITEASELSGKYKCWLDDSKQYCLTYTTTYDKRKEDGKDFLQQNGLAYQQKVNRKAELPNLIMDAYSAGNIDEAKQLEEEYKEICKIVEAKKRKRLQKKTSK
jgi:hypothetical protein